MELDELKKISSGKIVSVVVKHPEDNVYIVLPISSKTLKPGLNQEKYLGKVIDVDWEAVKIIAIYEWLYRANALLCAAVLNGKKTEWILKELVEVGFGCQRNSGKIEWKHAVEIMEVLVCLNLAMPCDYGPGNGKYQIVDDKIDDGFKGDKQLEFLVQELLKHDALIEKTVNKNYRFRCKHVLKTDLIKTLANPGEGNLKKINSELKIVKLKDVKFKVPGGYCLMSGYCFEHDEFGFVSFKCDGPVPYMPRGGKKALESIIQSGGFVGFDGMSFVHPM